MRNSLIVGFIFIFQLSAAQNNSEQKKWYVPDHIKLQFAGNIGFLSIGPGYLHGNNKLETDVSLGFLPEKIGGDHITSLTGKITYFPWKYPLNKHLALTPFSIGAYLNYSFGSQFDTILPNEYPKGYYWWASSLRLGGFIGGQIQLTTVIGNKKSIDLYYELGSYDLKFISYVQNREYLSLSDIISLALGVKLQF